VFVFGPRLGTVTTLQGVLYEDIRIDQLNRCQHKISALAYKYTRVNVTVGQFP